MCAVKCCGKASLVHTEERQSLKSAFTARYASCLRLIERTVGVELR